MGAAQAQDENAASIGAKQSRAPPAASRGRAAAPLAVALAATATASSSAQVPGTGEVESDLRSPQALCPTLRDQQLEQRCTVLRRAATGGIEAGVLRLSNDRRDEIVLAAALHGRWRVVRFAATACNHQDARGAVTLRSLRVHQIIPGGGPEIDVTVARWQDVLEPIGACFSRRVRELHRYVCALREGPWSCMGLEVEASAGETVILERPCAPPVWTNVPPAWSVDLSFTTAALEVRRREGTLPEIMLPWLGTRPLEEVLLPLGAPQSLPSPPDGL